MKDKPKLFSSDFQANPELMILSNLKDGSYMDVNAAFLNTLEFDRSEIVGKNVLELGFLTQKEFEILHQSIKSRHPLKNHEIVVRSKTGAVVVALLSCITIRIQNKPYLITVVTDITQQKYQEVANKKLQELEQSGIIQKLVYN
jgi:PAS domain S-box-containing protein